MNSIGKRRKRDNNRSDVRSGWNLIILVVESCDYRVSRANQGFTCHSFDQHWDNRYLYVFFSFACRCNLVRSRRMLLAEEDDPVYRPIVRLGVNDRNAIIRARLITRTAVITAFFPSFALFSSAYAVGTGLLAFASYYSFHNADAAKLWRCSGSQAIIYLVKKYRNFS